MPSIVTSDASTVLGCYQDKPVLICILACLFSYYGKLLKTVALPV